jgi:hypothetical protein
LEHAATPRKGMTIPQQPFQPVQQREGQPGIPPAAGAVSAARHMCDRGKRPHPGVATRHPAQQVGIGLYEWWLRHRVCGGSIRADWRNFNEWQHRIVCVHYACGMLCNGAPYLASEYIPLPYWVQIARCLLVPMPYRLLTHHTPVQHNKIFWGLENVASINTVYVWCGLNPLTTESSDVADAAEPNPDNRICRGVA